MNIKDLDKDPIKKMLKITKLNHKRSCKKQSKIMEILIKFDNERSEDMGFNDDGYPTFKKAEKSIQKLLSQSNQEIVKEIEEKERINKCKLLANLLKETMSLESPENYEFCEGFEYCKGKIQQLLLKESLKFVKLTKLRQSNNLKGEKE